MKRLLSILLILVMLSGCILPCYATEALKEEKVDYIYVDYEEFYENRAHYNELLLAGYAIIVSIGEEYAEQEIERFAQSSTSIHELVPAMERGNTRPTVEYNVHSNPSYAFTCDADFESIYTNVTFYGCVAYLIHGFNESYDNNLRIRVYGTTNDAIFSVPARSMIYKAIATESAEKRWYPMFYAPSDAYGDIYCIGH